MAIKKRQITDWRDVPIVVDIDFVALVLNCHPESVRRMAAKGEIPAIKVGGVWRINKADLKKYLRLEENNELS